MISLTDVAKHIGARTLFAGVTFTIGVADRVGLVGPNGCGKTTLLEILAGRLEADAGTITRNKRASVGYLAQELPTDSDRPLLAEMLAGHEHFDHLRARLDVIEEEMRQTDDAALLEQLAARHGDLERRFAEVGGYDLPSAARRILSGLGFGAADLERPTSEFSGGWLMRLALGRLLLTEPDLLLLDEPTNYLDLESVVWLEGYLRSYEGSMIAVSHDRALLNNLARRILEIDGGKIIHYKGNYDEYLEARARRRAGLEATRKQQEREIAKTQRFIDRFRYKNTKARQVQSRVKRLARLERIETPARSRQLHVSLPEPPPSSRVQLELREVWQGYGGPPVYRGIDLVIERGERPVLVGPNGAGKSTLMKLIAGALEPDRGERRVGRGVRIAYFTQHQVEALDYRRTILEEIGTAAPEAPGERLRGLLGRFLFTADDVFKTIGVLSGGEKARVALAKLLLAAPNLVLLDEPTSHLDIQSREVLEEALLEYSGTLVIVSHDRHFMERLSTRVIEVGGGTLRSYLGGYGEYVARRASEAAARGEPSTWAGATATGAGRDDAPPGPTSATDAGQPEERAAGRGYRTRADRRRAAAVRQERSRRLAPIQHEVARLEAEIERLGASMKELERRMAEPEFYEQGERFEEVFRSYKSLKAVVESRMQRWEQLLTELEGLGGDPVGDG